ncbi:MAG: hypothetical protein F4139_11395 [Gemmatimonadetes bacterium]|nr:hypothetical protein [Gemmatimonadota bacterium]MYK66296.1 hypothetical protein [Gemmatimonadota bacterium]
MVQRDYILRMIEELGAALIAVRKAIFGGKASASEVEDTLRRAASSAGMDIELARAASVEALPAMVAPTGEVEPARCWVLAEALMTDGVHRLHQGEPDLARSSLARAAALFGLVGPRGAFLTGFPEARVRIAEIEELLEGMGES